MEREFSAGGLVLRPLSGGWHLAVIEPAGRESGSGKPVLALPKGWIDEGEKADQTALREVREETGIEAQVIAKLGDIKYVYMRKWSDGARVFKVVSFYLLRYVTGEVGNITAWRRRRKPWPTKANARWRRRRWSMLPSTLSSRLLELACPSKSLSIAAHKEKM
jgi:8-oxo-dGTP pyrophosphatase MutT (NUDIX family)